MKARSQAQVNTTARKRKSDETGDVLSSSTKIRLSQFSAGTSHTDPQVMFGIVSSPLNKQEKSYEHLTHVRQEPNETKLSPLEIQITELKARHPGMILMIQNAYKYCFYGEDAEIASRVLHIAAVPHRNFVTASIPIHRLQVHARRLVEEGYKVGVVKQVETAALKAASDNRHSLFTRELAYVISKATLIGDEVNPLLQDGDMLADEGRASFILCVTEKEEPMGNISLGIVAFDPSTGEAYHDSFEEGPNREELEKRLAHLLPTEILAAESLSTETETLLKHSPARLERLPNERFDFSAAFLRVTKFLSNGSSNQTQTISNLAPAVITALGALLEHLNEFGLQQALHPEGLRDFTSRSLYLQMDATVLRNLEILQSTEGTYKGSLLWLLDRTRTKFGSRLLREWVSQPLRSADSIRERQEAVTELLRSPSETVRLLHGLLSGVPDVDRGLTTILHGRSNPSSMCVVLQSLRKLHSDLESILGVTELELSSPLLNHLVVETAHLLANVQHFWQNVDQEAAKQGDVTHFLRDYSDFSAVTDTQTRVAEVTRQLDDLRPSIARRIGVFRMDYASVSGHEYLVEVRVKQPVPADWRMVSQTKQLSRYRTPEVDRLFSELCRLREKLKADCQSAWSDFVASFNEHYFNHKKAVRNLATLDALLSLSQLAHNPGYCRPEVIETGESRIIIKDGRHPVVSALDSIESFIPNDTTLQGPERHCMILSGPNMGGKSCYIRQVALIAIMAHIGSYVPAESAELSVLDCIFTRMGARDELFDRRSTLLVELLEASNILNKATPRSLALLDELGRGTSSCDGAAIAVAALHQLITKVRCLTLFVTHYPSVMQLIPELNYHMGFLLHPAEGEIQEQLTFLYEVREGPASRSYGLNVARLAGIPPQLLTDAAKKAEELEHGVEAKSQLRLNLQKWWTCSSASDVLRIFKESAAVPM
ncbi:DNA mismatch repair protein Msh3 isoform X2 [Anabrus simplex]|uniref:DNA mismatch repair protein Msh3 isoform X2 n=1 Tax=Anabrus simplex TaxID=316456 RepID=UPI0035A3C996